MKRISLPIALLVSVGLLGACTPRQDRKPKPPGGFHSTQQDDKPKPRPQVDPEPEEPSQPGTPPSDVPPQAPSDTPPPPKVGDLPYAKQVPGKPGFVTSPYAPYQGYIDVRGFPPGTEVKDPYSGKTFLVP
jgi:hypothetical protein